MNKEFIYEGSRTQKYTTVFVVAATLLFLGIILFLGNSFLSTNSVTFQSFTEYISNQITQITPIGLFIVSFFGSFFFIPAPIDFLFIGSLAKGYDPIFAYILVLVSSIVGNILNYFIGVKLSKYAVHFISIKKLYETKRKVNKYGAVAIVIFNLTPLPGSLLTFALGIAKYNFVRMIVYFTLGISIKFGIMTLYFLYF